MFAFEQVYVVSTTWPLVKLYTSELCCEMLWTFWLKGWRSNWRARELLTLLWFLWGRTKWRRRLQLQVKEYSGQRGALHGLAESAIQGSVLGLHGFASLCAALHSAALLHSCPLLLNSAITTREKTMLRDALTFCTRFEVCFANFWLQRMMFSRSCSQQESWKEIILNIPSHWKNGRNRLKVSAGVGQQEPSSRDKLCWFLRMLILLIHLPKTSAVPGHSAHVWQACLRMVQ